MATLRVRRRFSAFLVVALLSLVAFLFFRSYSEGQDENDTAPLIDCSGDTDTGGVKGVGGSSTASWDSADLERLRTTGNLTPRCRKAMDYASNNGKEESKGSGGDTDSLGSNGGAKRSFATEPDVPPSEPPPEFAESKRDSEEQRTLLGQLGAVKDAVPPQLPPAPNGEPDATHASSSQVSPSEREAKLKELVRTMMADVMARQEKDLKEDEEWLTVTLAAKTEKYKKDFAAYSVRKEKHDAEMAEWLEKYNKTGEGETKVPAPALISGPPPAPINLNTTLAQVVLDRLKHTAAGRYRFEIGHAIAIFGLPRTGSTVLFNMARLLVREVDPNMVSGFAIAFDKALAWKAAKVSVVMKMHELAKAKNKVDGKEVLNPYKEADVFEGVLFSHRSPGNQVCSWCHLVGDVKCKPPKEEVKRRAVLSTFKTSVKQKCYRLMGIQSRLYKNLAPLVIYDFSYEDEISAPPSSPFASPEFDPFENPRHRRMLSTMAHLRMLLGLEDRVDDVALARLARELSMLRAISVKEKGKHPADWEHPVSLMHHNHVSAYSPGQNLTGVSNALVPSKIAKEDCGEITRVLGLDRQCSIWLGRRGRWVGA